MRLRPIRCCPIPGLLSLVVILAGYVFAPTPVSAIAPANAVTSPTPAVNPHITITAPAHGTFTTAANVTVAGQIQPAGNLTGRLRLNNVPIAFQADGTFTHVMPLTPDRLFHPILAEFASPESIARARIVVIQGAALASETRVPEGVGLRLHRSGMDRLEPIIARLVDVDLVALLPPGPVFSDEVCIKIPPFGASICGDAEVHISRDPPPQLAQVLVDADPATDLINVTLHAHDLFVRAEVGASAGPISADCKIDIRAAAIRATGAFALEPAVDDPTIIDVTQQGAMSIAFDDFADNPDCGDLPDEVVDRLISLFVGSVQGRLQSGLASFLNSIDANGNTPLASALETVLTDLSLERLANEVLLAQGPAGLHVELPFKRLVEEPSGLTLSADTYVTELLGAAPAQCNAPPGTPTAAASYDVLATLPPFQPTTPRPNPLPYDVGFAISISSLNQLLRAIAACGLMQTQVVTLDVGGEQRPITAGLLSAFVPAFQRLDPITPLVVRLRPTLPPVVTNTRGPAGEAVDIHISQFLVEVMDPAAPATFLQVSIDLRLGLDVAIDATGALQPRLGTLAELKPAILRNGIGAEPDQLQRFFGQLLAFVPQLNATLAPIALPTFLDFALSAVALVPQDGYLSLFMTLVPMP